MVKKGLYEVVTFGWRPELRGPTHGGPRRRTFQERTQLVLTLRAEHAPGV